MNLQEMRKLLVEVSGAANLVLDVESYADNGANHILNTAQNLLDSWAPHTKSVRRHIIPIASGDFGFELRELRRVEAIFVVDAVDGRSNMTPSGLSLREFLLDNPKLISDWDSGVPMQWAINNIGLSPDLSTRTLASFDSDSIVGADGIQFGSDFDLYGIIFAPKANEAYTIDIIGEFGSKVLIDNKHTSFWTDQEPELLARVGAYVIDGRMRNRSAQADWLASIEVDIERLSTDRIELDMSTQGTALREGVGYG